MCGTGFRLDTGNASVEKRRLTSAASVVAMAGEKTTKIKLLLPVMFSSQIRSRTTTEHHDVKGEKTSKEKC